MWLKSLSYPVKLFFAPLRKMTIPHFIKKYLIQDKGDYIINNYGLYGAREIVKAEYVGKPKLLAFEDTVLYGVENPHEYLAAIYGDYMKLPPEDKRHIHLLNAEFID